MTKLLGAVAVLVSTLNLIESFPQNTLCLPSLMQKSFLSSPFTSSTMMTVGSAEEEDGWEAIQTKQKRGNKRGEGSNNATNSTDDDDQLKSKNTLPEISYISPPPKDVPFKPVMILLCGIPGSGKSTFAKSLERSMPYKFVRINQDDLGHRKRCEERARLVISQGKCPVIDRCNFDKEQRKHFISIAYEHGIPVDCVVLETEILVTVDECIQRCIERRGHPTIAPADARSIVIGMAKQMQPPKIIGNKEGIQVVHYITNRHRLDDVLFSYLNKK